MIKKNKFNIIVFIIYSGITLSLIYFHEIWRDEAQQWFIVKELSVIDIIKQMKYEGHFLLWYFILMPFAKLGFPIITQNLISWAISCLAVILILKKAPFSKLTKCLIIFSVPFLYYYSVHSRVYCLILLSVVLCAITYKNRIQKPIQYILSIALLANTHIIMYGLIGVILLDHLIEIIKIRKDLSKNEINKIVISLILFTLLLFITVLPLFGSLTTNKDLNKVSGNILYNIIILILQPLKQLYYCFMIIFNFRFIAIIICGLVVVVIYYCLKYYTKITLKILVTLLWQWIIYTFVFGVNLQKAISIILIILFFVWTNRESGNYKVKDCKETKCLKIIIIILLFFNIIVSIILGVYDIIYNYSSSRETAKFISENIEKGSIMVTGDLPEACSSIIAYTDKVKFYNVQMDDYFSYITWNGKIREKLEDDFIDKLKKKFNGNEDLYYVYVKDKVFKQNDKKLIKKLVKQNVLKKVYESNTAFEFEETYIIYKIK